MWTYTADGKSVNFGDGHDGEPLVVRKVEGLHGFGQVRSSSKPIPRGHGGIRGAHFLDISYPVFTLWAFSEDMEALRDEALAALQVQPEEEGLLKSGERQVYCRPVQVDWPDDAATTSVLSDVKVAFEVSDPRSYSTTRHSEKLDVYETGGGLDYSLADYSKEFTVLGLDKSLTNAGNIATPPLIRFYGPSSGTCTGVHLLNRTTGASLSVLTDITSGQILTVDMRAFVAATGDRVIDLSNANRYGSWQQPREPMLLQPGSNLLRVTADGTTAGMETVIHWRDAWL